MSSMKQLAITLIEVGNSEAPNIGTITGRNSFQLRIKAVRALKSHFDCDVIDIKFPNELDFESMLNSPPVIISVTLDSDHRYVAEVEVELQQTWIY